MTVLYIYSMQDSTSVLEEEASRVGLYISPDKCKVMVSTIQYVEWDSRHPSQGLYMEVVDEFLLFG